MDLFQNFVSKMVYRFRAVPIGNAIIPFLKNEKTFLDIGCFDGAMGHYISTKKNIKIMGVDIKLPKKTFIDAVEYDGKKLPFKSNSFDSALLIDVLHHSKTPLHTLLEAKRVARSSIIIKDVFYTTFLELFYNAFVDLQSIFLGFAPPNKYFTKPEWKSLIRKAGLKIIKTDYSFEMNRLDFLLHIIMRLEKRYKK